MYDDDRDAGADLEFYRRSLEELTDAVNRLNARLDRVVDALVAYQLETAAYIDHIRTFYGRKRR